MGKIFWDPVGLEHVPGERTYNIRTLSISALFCIKSQLYQHKISNIGITRYSAKTRFCTKCRSFR